MALVAEELKQNNRGLLRAIGHDHVTKQDIKWFATAPGPDGEARFRMPTTWDLERADGYFQTKALPRDQRGHLVPGELGLVDDYSECGPRFPMGARGCAALGRGG